MTDDVLEAWEVDAGDWPAAGDAAERLAFAVRYAILAPSGHNTQPWLFRVQGDVLELFADRRRALPVVDPEDRALVISCGAALAMLETALAHFGCGVVVTLVPEGPGADLLAHVQLTASAPITPASDDLFAAITRRHTNRAPFLEQPLPADLLDRLVGLALAEDVWLEVRTEIEARAAIAELVAEGDRIQARDPRFRRELAAWIHPNRHTGGDGMPGWAFGIGDLASNLGPFLVRSFDWGKGQAARDRELATGSPVLAVLGCGRDNPRAWMQTGRALGRILLAITAAGAHSSYLNQPIEVGALRPELANRIGVAGFPQILLRLGYGQPTRPTPRRPLAEVLDVVSA